MEEAYLEIRRMGIKDYEDFSTREGMKFVAFIYSEITIFDRIKDEEYRNVLFNSWSDSHNKTE